MPRPKYDRELDQIEGWQREGRGQRLGFWSLGAFILAASLGLLQVLSQQGAFTSAPRPTPVPAPMPAQPAPVTKAQVPTPRRPAQGDARGGVRPLGAVALQIDHRVEEKEWTHAATTPTLQP